MMSVRVHRMGADAILVGEALMREQDIGEKVKELAFAVYKDELIIGFKHNKQEPFIH